MKFPRIKRAEPSEIMETFKRDTQKQIGYHEAEAARLQIIVADARERIANHQAAADALHVACMSINITEGLRDDVQVPGTLSAN